MSEDHFLVLGLIFLILSIPAIVSAWAESRPPRLAAVALVSGGLLVLYALNSKPGGYRLYDLHEAVYGVIKQVFL